MGANIGIGLIRPLHRGGDGIIEVQAICPVLAFSSEFSLLDLGGEIRGPGVCGDVWFPAVAAQHLLGDAGIPHVVQIQLCVLPLYMDSIAPLSNVLRVQRLVDVADEVDDELGGLVAPPRVQAAVQQLGGVVLDRTHDASVLLAIPVKVDTAVGRRRVLGVDEVEVLGEAAPFRIADAVCPRRNASEVVLSIVPQQILEISRRVILDKVARDISNSDMAQTCRTTVSIPRMAEPYAGGYSLPQAATLGKSSPSTTALVSNFMVSALLDLNGAVR
jgi:hypothetical protein